MDLPSSSVSSGRLGQPTQYLILQGRCPVGTWVTGVGTVYWHHPDAVAPMSFPDTQADPLLRFSDCVMRRNGKSLMNHL